MTQNNSCMKRLIQTLLLGVLLVVFAECTSRRVYADYSAGSGFDRTQIDSNTLRNLEVLGRVWGFVKYHHPAFSDDRYDLDFELFELLPQVADATAAARNEILASWIDGFGGYKTTPERYEQILASDSVFERRTDIAWIRDTVMLGRELSERLVRLRQADRTAGNYYVSGFYDNESGIFIGNPCFDHEKAYKNLKNPDYGYRLLTVFRFWNMVEYFFPTKYLLDRDWDEILPEYIGRMARLTDGSYQRETWRMIAALNDTHAQRGNFKLFGWCRVPIDVNFVEGRLMVVSPDTVTIDRSRVAPFHLGDEIVEVNGYPIDYYMAQVREFLPCSNEEGLRKLTADVTLRSKSESDVLLRYRRNGKICDTLVGVEQMHDFELTYLFDQIGPYKWLSDSILYLYPAKYKREDEGRIVAMMAQSNGLVVDLRCYPTYEFAEFLGKHVIPSSAIPPFRATYPSFVLPGVFYETSITWPTEEGAKYSNPIAVLVDSRTVSYSECIVQWLQCCSTTQTVGTQSAGANGNISEFTLPGDILCCFSGLGWYYLDGYAVQRQGVKIDREVRTTIRGILAGRDEVLEAAIQIIREWDRNNI